MVKGVSRQVIVLEPHEGKLYDQAIFILSDGVMGKEGITEQMLLKEANRLIKKTLNQRHISAAWKGFYMLLGALMTAGIWILSSFF